MALLVRILGRRCCAMRDLNRLSPSMVKYNIMEIRHFSSSSSSSSNKNTNISAAAADDQKKDAPAPSSIPPALRYASVGLVSYGTIYLSLLGFCFIGLEMNFLSCEMVGIDPDAAIGQFVKAASSIQVITPETVKSDPLTMNYAYAIGINRAIKMGRLALSCLLSLGIAPYLGVDRKDEWKMLLVIYGTSFIESDIEDYM